MKNTPIGAETRGAGGAPPAEVSGEWRRALDLLDADLRRRGSAQRTRVAYRSDLLQLAASATQRDLEPAAVEHRALRRYAASLSDAGNNPTTVASKLAAARALFPPLRDHGIVAQNPAEL